jgi:teichuronic acid biosynthesis glycosyltransferase TuaC
VLPSTVGRSAFVTLERQSANASVLVLTGAWPTSERPTYGVFIRRQVDSLVAAGVPIDVLAIHGYRTPMAYVQAAELMARRRIAGSAYRLLHAHGGEAGLAALPGLGVPLIVSYSGSDLLGPPRGDGRISLRRRWQTRLCRAGSLLSAANIVKSRNMERRLPARARTKTHIIPNGVDRSVFFPRPRSEARAELGWPDDELIVLFAANPALPYKRHALAVTACQRAARTIGAVRLFVANGLPPDAIPMVMNAADCLLHPSASEGSPNVIKEALACNLPIVATPVGDIPERLANIESCHVCDPSVTNIANALIACLEPPRRSNGNLTIESLSQERIAARVLAVYRDVAGPSVSGS